MADSKKYNGSTWEHSLRKLATATDTFTTLPVDVYADGNNATVGISGNTVQNGTPTPGNPIMPNGTGDRTENLIRCTNTTSTTSGGAVINQTAGKSEVIIVSRTATESDGSAVIDVLAELTAGTYTLSVDGITDRGARNLDRILIRDEDSNVIVNYVQTGKPKQFTISEDVKITKLSIVFAAVAEYSNQVVRVMLNSGSTSKPYEPYGYKIPISSAGQTTPIYLGEVETTRRIGKIDLSEVSWTMLASGLWRTLDIPNIKYVSASTELGGGIAEKYTIHTGAGMISALNCIAIDVSQVSVNTGGNTETPTGMFWYVLATEETGIVNEPLMKIGDYADEVSGITVPTITGADSFDVETTLKPSEVELTYTGWHDATVQEWDGSQWQ